jgi:hypothetical protein
MKRKIPPLAWAFFIIPLLAILAYAILLLVLGLYDPADALEHRNRILRFVFNL